MASEIITTTFGDCRLVVPHGLEAPTEPPPGGGGGGGPPPTLPSYEMGTENWDDQEMGGEGGGGGIPQGGIKGVKAPKGPPPKEKPEKGEKGEKEEGEPEEGEPEEEEGEGTGDKVADDLIDKYTKSHSADADQMRDQMLNPETEGSGGDTETKMPWPSSVPRPSRADVETFWDHFEKKRREYSKDPRTRDKSQDPGHDPKIQPPGIGLGGELMNIGIKPERTGVWKEAVKKWFKSLPIPQLEDKWTREDVRLQSPLRQLRELTGHTARLPARNVLSPIPKVAKVLVLVDVSGSVFNKGVQESFASILAAVPKNVAEIEIFTFDTSGQEGPFKPKTYNPKIGGGGTEPWGFIANLLATPKYSSRAIDGYMMLTDGAFAKAPEGLITRPKKWCFVMTSTYTSDAIPSGAKIIETYVDDPEYQKHMREGKSTDVMKGVVIKK